MAIPLDCNPILKSLQPPAVRSVGVIGAGLMGAGIAAAHVEQNISVKMYDTNETALSQTVSAIQSAAEFGKMSAALCALPGRPRSQIVKADTLADLRDVDLVVEAVVESLAVKRKLFTKLEQHLSANAIIASNTSSISISQLASRLNHPERCCGLHFCHPVRERKLVEVVRGERTSERTIERAVTHLHSLGKSPIVVEDSPGFVVNRFLTLYLNEALDLLQQGVPVERIDKVAVQFGMPVGPLTAIDAIGIDVALRVGTLMQSAFPDRLATTSDLLVVMFTQGYLGEKCGKGFYVYNEAGERLPLLDKEVDALVAERVVSQQNLTDDEISQRLFLPWILEATRILDENIVTQIEDIESAVLYGLGFPADKQGVLAWGDSLGARHLLDLLKPLAAQGARFQPTHRLRECAATGQSLSRPQLPLRKAG